MLLLVGFTEELTTRGLPVVGLRSRLQEAWVWFLSSALFAAMHLVNIFAGQGVSTTLTQVGMAFLGGTVFYILRRSTGTLLWAMMLHGLWDFSTVAVGHGTAGPLASLGGTLNLLAGFAGLVVVAFVIRGADERIHPAIRASWGIARPPASNGEVNRKSDQMAAGRTINLDYPFTGHWLVQNSPANRVPSHGTDLFASAYAIDFVPVDSAGRSARVTPRSLFRPEPAGIFPGFGRPVLAPCDGTVVAVENTLPDHEAYRGFPSIGYALAQRQRAARGWRELAGNHVLIRYDSCVVALCHLQQDSVLATPGDEVHVGQHIAGCGNSGNSTQPHVHLQVVDRLPVNEAFAVPMTFRRVLPRNGDVVVAR